MADKAGRWVRVSGDSQSEADQLPDINSYCDQRSYTHGQTYTVHGKSAYKGEQDPYWQKVVKDIQAGVINVIVCWMVDRLDRQNILHAIPMALAVLDAGGRIEFSEQPECNLDKASPTIDDDVKAFSDRIHDANRESKIKSKRILKAHRRRRAEGSAIGRPPWGYEIICDVCKEAPVRPRCKDHKKLFVPTAAGRHWIPLIYKMIIDGKSLRDVAEFLTSEGVDGKKWNENYIGHRVIDNPVYYGQRRNNGQLVTEGLVSYSEWQEANAKVASRARLGRSTSVHEKAMLSPVCGNQQCDATGDGDSPMYRIWGGYGVNRKPYYRCSGKGPQRRGCGNMIPVSELDEIVIEAMLSDHMNEHYEHEFIPGDDRSDEIGKLREQAMDAYRKGDKARFIEIDKQADELAALPSIAPCWKERPTGISEGEYFASLGNDERREYIATSRRITAFKHDDGTPAALIFPRNWSGASQERD